MPGKLVTANHLLRIRLLSVGVFLLVGLLGVRLYSVQVVHGEEFTARADRQYAQPNERLFRRGSVFFEDKNGVRIAAATLAQGFLVAITPSSIVDPEAVYTGLASILPLSRERFLLQAAKQDDPYEEIAHRVSADDAARIESLALPGVRVYREQWRYYPGASLAAQTLGFTGFRGDAYAGQYGVERYYDDTLRRDDDALSVNFFAEIFGNLKETLYEKKPAEGDVTLSLEPSVERLVEGEIEKIESRWKADHAGGIVMDPKTGEIFALAVLPSFDLNAFSGASAESFAHPFVERVFEMGSVMKPITVAIGLDTGAVTSETTYYDAGSVTLNTETISNYDGKGRGTVDMQQVLNKSLNTGIAFVVGKIGNRRFAERLLAFGFGEETGIDLPNETRGLAGNLESPRDVEYVTAGFGQGIAVTPIGMVRALAALANGGKLVTPHLGRSVSYPFGVSKKISYIPEEGSVISLETSEEITRMLVRVVDEALLGGSVALPRYSIAAKTGTAEIAREGAGGYDESRFLHSFFGYFPAYDPRFIVFLYAHDPKGVRYASETLTTPFMNIVTFLINYYEIPPDR